MGIHSKANLALVVFFCWPMACTLGANCDPSQLSYKVFNDQACTVLNQTMTKAMARVPRQFYGTCP